MAGARQHFIPRMLLRNFSDAKGQVRVVRKDGKTHLASINNIGLETNFNGPPGPGTADEAITVDENRIAKLLQQFVRNVDTKPNAVEAAAVIAHLTTRTKAMRDTAKQVSGKTLDILEVEFSSEESARTSLIAWVKARPELIGETLDEQFAATEGSVGLAQFKASQGRLNLLAYWQGQVISHLNGQQGSSELAAFASALLKHMRMQIPQKVDAAHIETARVASTPQGRVEFLRQFSFSIAHFDQGLILGDAVGWCGRNVSDGFPLFSLDDDIDIVAMPLSADLALYGCRGAGLPELSTALMNAGSIAASSEYVICQPKRHGILNFSKSIGSGTARAMQLRMG